MLIGTYKHQLDEKGRFRIPTKFKTELGENFIVTKGTDHCLFAFAKTEMSCVFDKLKNLPLFDSEVQKSSRLLLSSAFESESDNQGRILLSQELRNFAEIKKNVVFIGVGNRVEIWADEKWAEYGNADFDSTMNALKNSGV